MGMSKYKDFKKEGLSREQNGYYVARKRMITEQMTTRGVKDPRVIAVMSRIPRHLFIPEALASQAYSDYPVNIGEGQTISQPFMVAVMTEALQLKGDEKILEIGTGSGYQSAVLAELCRHLYTIERFKNLANQARKILYDIGITNFSMRIGDGTLGWPEEAPFDGILVTAGGPVIPDVYSEQLKEGGRIVIPVGDEESQQLIVAVKTGNNLQQEVISGCRFVKLIGRHGFEA